MKEKKFRSIRVDLAFIIGIMVVILVSAISIIAYQSAFSALRDTFINQMKNLNTSITNVTEDYYNQQIMNARFLSKDERVIKALKTEDYTEVIPVLSNYFTTQGNLENLFLTTLDEGVERFVSWYQAYYL